MINVKSIESLRIKLEIAHWKWTYNIDFKKICLCRVVSFLVYLAHVCNYHLNCRKTMFHVNFLPKWLDKIKTFIYIFKFETER